MEASPSLLAQAVLGTVQTVSVCKPPPTREISSSFNERAPLRTKTLLWSFMLFSFRHFESVNLDPSSSKKALGLQQTISIPAGRTPGDDVGVDETSANLLDFFRIQITRALAIQHSVLVVHVFLLFVKILGIGKIPSF